MACNNSNGFNGWLRSWIEPRVIVLVIGLIISLAVAWQAMGSKVNQNQAQIDDCAHKIASLDDEYVPRGELIQRLGRIEDRLAEQKQDLREIKRALGVKP